MATLPPKPGSSKHKWHQQRISPGIPANQAGLRRADRLARLIGIQLAEGKFTWAEWLKDTPQDSAEGATAGELMEAFRASLGLNDFKWREHYLYYGLNRIPADQPLTPEAIIAAALTKEANTRVRQMACERLTRFAKFAGVEVDLTPFSGSYSAKAMAPRDIPSDERIIEVIEDIQNPKWRNVFWCMAVFGCRDHEVFFSRLEPIGGVMALNVLEGKTGPRFPVMPMPGGWVDKVNLDNLPTLNVTEHQLFGQRTAKAWRRLTGGEAGFTPYALRHAYSIRCHLKGIPTALVAKWMGHSESINSSVYRRWVNQDMHLQAWERAQG